MTSALTSRGSTRAWRTIRQPYTDHLTLVGTVPCWRSATNTDPSPNCTRTIHAGQPWHLGHRTDRALGGGDTDLDYECQPCSARSGGILGALISKVGARQAARKPSRRW